MTRDEIDQFPEDYLDRRLNAELDARSIRITHRFGWGAAGEIVEAMHKRGYWCELKSPFDKDQPWFAGFTPHGCSGWNGQPDYQMSASSGPIALAKAALLALVEEAKENHDR